MSIRVGSTGTDFVPVYVLQGVLAALNAITEKVELTEKALGVRVSVEGILPKEIHLFDSRARG